MTELGARLKEAREAKHYTLDQLQDITKIQKRYLAAIEEGNYNVLPGRFYARAFIKQYAEAVDLDPQALFEEFKSDIPTTDSEEVSTQLSRVKTHKAVSPADNKLINLLPKLLTALVIVGIGVLVWVISQQVDTDEQAKEPDDKIIASEKEMGDAIPKEEPEPKEDKTDTEQPKEEDPDPESDDTATEQQLTQVEARDGRTPVTTYQLENSEEFKISITSTGRSYIGVENGKGKSFYNQELQAGETIDFDMTAEQTVELNIGNLPDVEVKINGQSLTYAFAPQEKVHQRITILFESAAGPTAENPNQ